LGKFPQLFCLPRRHVGHTNFGTWGLANSIRGLSERGGRTVRSHTALRSNFIEESQTMSYIYRVIRSRAGGSDEKRLGLCYAMIRTLEACLQERSPIKPLLGFREKATRSEGNLRACLHCRPWYCVLLGSIPAKPTCNR
jgi:hypothetical protein